MNERKESDALWQCQTSIDLQFVQFKLAAKLREVQVDASVYLALYRIDKVSLVAVASERADDHLVEFVKAAEWCESNTLDLNIQVHDRVLQRVELLI